MTIASFQRRLHALRKPEVRAVQLKRLRTLAAVGFRRLLSPHPEVIRIGERRIGPGEPVFIIAEIGVNHNGSVARAKELIDAAVRAGADAVKLQKRHLPATYQADVLEHPERHEQGFSYLIPILKEFEFGEPEYRELSAYAAERGILFFASAWDEPSVDFLLRFDPPCFKVASADLINIPLIERLLEIGKPLIFSTGMASLDEIDETVSLLHRRRATFVLLHCQSTYPAASDTLNLAMIGKLRGRYGVPVGYSGHELGIHHTLAAVALGASVVEKHITLDRSLPGPDHTASLEPDEFKELVSRIREYEVAYGVPVRRISRGEVANRLTLRKSVVAAVDIPKGTLITRTMLTAKSPGSGLSPQRLYDLVGRRAIRDVRPDDMFTERDLLHPDRVPRRLPRFSSKWGLKARFFELEKLARLDPQPAFFEFHLSDQDLEFPFDTSKRYPQELYIHAPEYFKREVVDLASDDDRLWEQSIAIMQRTIEKTREIASSFRGTPKIIIHVGGMSLGKPIEDHERLLRRSEEAFRRLDTAGVEIMPENLPPFGWFFSGIWHCNIFGAAEEMVQFCKGLNYRMCLDLSHAWLYCTHYGLDYLDYLRAVAPLTAHIHIADGRGSHKEGLQIGEGDVPFEEAFRVLREHLPEGVTVSWVPEIWQGHLDDYYHFKIALSRLAQYPFLSEGIMGRV